MFSRGVAFDRAAVAEVPFLILTAVAIPHDNVGAILAGFASAPDIEAFSVQVTSDISLPVKRPALVLAAVAFPQDDVSAVFLIAAENVQAFLAVHRLDQHAAAGLFEGPRWRVWERVYFAFRRIGCEKFL